MYNKNGKRTIRDGAFSEFPFSPTPLMLTSKSIDNVLNNKTIRYD